MHVTREQVLRVLLQRRVGKAQSACRALSKSDGCSARCRCVCLANACPGAVPHTNSYPLVWAADPPACAPAAGQGSNERGVVLARAPNENDKAGARTGQSDWPMAGQHFQARLPRRLFCAAGVVRPSKREPVGLPPKRSSATCFPSLFALTTPIPLLTCRSSHRHHCARCVLLQAAASWAAWAPLEALPRRPRSKPVRRPPSRPTSRTLRSTDGYVALTRVWILSQLLTFLL